MIALMSETAKQIERLKWVAHAADFFICTLEHATDQDIADGVQHAIFSFNSGQSGAGSVYAGYDLIRRRIRTRSAIFHVSGARK